MEGHVFLTLSMCGTRKGGDEYARMFPVMWGPWDCIHIHILPCRKDYDIANRGMMWEIQ